MSRPKGFHHSEETRQKISLALTGKIISEETREKFRGSRNPNWNGGKITKAIKEKVRQRDNQQCVKCGAPACLIHHIDQDVHNNDLNNLCSLCMSCHQRIHIIKGRKPSSKTRMKMKIAWTPKRRAQQSLRMKANNPIWRRYCVTV